MDNEPESTKKSGSPQKNLITFFLGRAQPLHKSSLKSIHIFSVIQSNKTSTDPKLNLLCCLGLAEVIMIMMMMMSMILYCYILVLSTKKSLRAPVLFMPPNTNTSVPLTNPPCAALLDGFKDLTLTHDHELRSRSRTCRSSKNRLPDIPPCRKRRLPMATIR